jgi:acetyl-CoA acetyltransferase
MAPRKVYIAGVGCTAFEKPRNRRDYPEIAVEAATKALLDAGLTYDQVEQAYAGYVYGVSRRLLLRSFRRAGKLISARRTRHAASALCTPSA